MKTNALSLRELQIWMTWIITDPRGVSEALGGSNLTATRYRSRYIEPRPSARTSIQAVDQNELEARLSVYAEAYFSRIFESMESDFSKTRAIVGENTFSKLVADYLKAYPSRTTNIGEVGRSFASFVSKYEELLERASLSEIIDLDWKAIECFYATEERPFNKGKFSEIDDEAWCKVHLKFTSSIKMLQSRLPFDLIWNMDDGLDGLEIEEGPKAQSFILWRHGDEVKFKKVEDLEFEMLGAFMRGLTLSEVFDHMGSFEKGASEEISSKIMVIFSSWISEGLIVDFTIQENQKGESK